MRNLRERPLEATLLATALALVAVVAIAIAFGVTNFVDAWSHLHLRWLIVAAASSLLAPVAYLVAYRTVIHHDHGPRMKLSLAIRVVLLGFGPFAPGGGFVVDRRALHAVLGDEDEAAVRVLGLGALEWAVLSPLAWLSAVALLITDDERVMRSVLWPWALAVPIGFGLGLRITRIRRLQRLDRGAGGVQGALARALGGVQTLRELARPHHVRWSAWIGMAAYWLLDIASLYGALRFVSLHPTVLETVLAFATGYALTRRSLPLGGAGITEALMTFSLHWVGMPVPAALAAVVVYRLFNFLLPALPALLVRRRVWRLLPAP